MKPSGYTLKVPALRVHQWLPTWNQAEFDEANYARRPQPHFYVFSMSAKKLGALCAVHRRGGPDNSAFRLNELAVQRHLEKDRTEEIERFIQHGYPWSELNKRNRSKEESLNLVRPGWLPTAIVVNILLKGDERQGHKLHAEDAVDVGEAPTGGFSLNVPDAAFKDPNWRPKDLAPMEVIDGQHRLMALHGAPTADDYELPVVAFQGLDISWQAYLFYTVNIKPTKLKKSLAFDLFPLLRSQTWLETGGELKVYRETRAQELVEVLCYHDESPWHERINMLGASGKGNMVTQAAWVRALTATCLKTPRTRKQSIGGLFTSNQCSKEPLPWTRAQQAAFILEAGRLLRDQVLAHKGEWARTLRGEAARREEPAEPDPAFYGRNSLLGGDQGIGAFLQVLNDVTVTMVSKLGLCSWQLVEDDDMVHLRQVSQALADLRRQPVGKMLNELAAALAPSDWRSFSFEDLDEDERRFKAGLRGGGGYKQFKARLLGEVATKGGDVGKAAMEALEAGEDGE